MSALKLATVNAPGDSLNCNLSATYRLICGKGFHSGFYEQAACSGRCVRDFRDRKINSLFLDLEADNPVY